jgi:1,4-dihydroxy-2-naphthoate octaprenyltransferase
MSAFLIGLVYEWYRHGSLPPVTTAVLGAAVLAVDMATTGFNSFFDYFRGVDHRRTNRESDKVLVHEGVPAGVALVVSVALYGIAIVLGLILAFIATPWVIPIGVLSMAVGFLYTGGPIPISRTPLGELFAGGFLGWVLVTLTIFVITPTFDPVRDTLVGIPSFLLVASILTVNNTCDIEGDRLSGRRTLSILLGRRGGEALVYALGAGAFLAAALLGIYGIIPRATLIGTAIAAATSLPVYRQMHRRGYSHATKGPSMGSISRIFLFYTVCIIVPMAFTAIT